MSKLYATATSEKASKGQGGNNFVEVDMRDDEKQICFIKAIPDGTNTRLFVRVLDKIDFEKTFYIAKGKRQKGDN